MLFLGIISTGYAQNESWYRLKKAETYVTDFFLPARQSKEITIDSTKPIIVGFKTDAIYAPNSDELYKEFLNTYKANVIKLADKNGTSVSTVWGGSTEFKPIDNKVVIEVSNLIDRDFKIVIYKNDLTQAP
jgi:hypothetical protein